MATGICHNHEIGQRTEDDRNDNDDKQKQMIFIHDVFNIFHLYKAVISVMYVINRKGEKQNDMQTLWQGV